MSRSLLCIVAALIAFALCVLQSVGVVSGVNYEAWLAGGLFALAAAQLP